MSLSINQILTSKQERHSAALVSSYLRGWSFEAAQAGTQGRGCSNSPKSSAAVVTLDPSPPDPF